MKFLAPGKGFEPLSANAQPLSCVRFRGGRLTTWLTWQFYLKQLYLNTLQFRVFCIKSKDSSQKNCKCFFHLESHLIFLVRILLESSCMSQTCCDFYQIHDSQLVLGSHLFSLQYFVFSRAWAILHWVTPNL